MITTGAASDSTYERGFSLVYQAYTPASRYLTGAVDLLKATDPSAKRIAILHENDKFSTDVCNAVRDYAVDQGYEVVFFEGYDSGTTDFAPFINKMESTAPDAVLGGGHFQDGSTFAKTAIRKATACKTGGAARGSTRVQFRRDRGRGYRHYRPQPMGDTGELHG